MDSESADFTAARLLRAFFNKFDQKETAGPIGSPANAVELAGKNGNPSPASDSSKLEAWPRPWQSA
jgi:hypothetical protein